MFDECGMTDKKLNDTVSESNLKIENILLMNIDKNGNTVIISKEAKK